MKTVLALLLVLMTSFLMGCSERYREPTQATVQLRNQLHLTPDELLQHPCKAIEAGTTVRSLGVGYAHNTSCVHQYRILIENQQSYKDRIKEQYGGEGDAD